MMLEGIPESRYTFNYYLATSLLTILHKQYAEVVATLRMVTPAARKHVIKPGTYCGASWLRNTVPPMIPPTPPIATMFADVKARFHWPTMLLAWYVINAGTFEFAPFQSQPAV